MHFIVNLKPHGHTSLWVSALRVLIHCSPRAFPSNEGGALPLILYEVRPSIRLELPSRRTDNKANSLSRQLPLRTVWLADATCHQRDFMTMTPNVRDVAQGRKTPRKDRRVGSCRGLVFRFC